MSGTFRLRLTHEGLEGNTYHRGNGTFLLAYASEEVTVTPTGKFPLKHAPAVLRAGILQRLDALFPRDTAFFAKALLLGDRSDVDYETNTAFKLSGISHIIAVSGLHVSILFSVVFLLTGKRRILTALFGIPVLVLFAAVTGFSPSVTRACVMQLLMILATLVDQEYDPPTALSAAVLLMLLVNPLVITAASFQLSVGCMAGIFLFSEKIQRWLCGLPFWSGWKGRGLRIRIRNWLTSGAAVTLSAMFFTMPLVAYYFGCISLVSVLTNLLTLWAVSWIFYGIMAVCLLSLLWNQGAVGLAWLISWLIRYVLTVAKTVARIPLTAVFTESPYIVCWIVVCYLLLLIFLLGKQKRPRILASCLVLSLMVALACSWLEPLVTDCRITVLDVGQGQSVLLQSRGKSYLVDCGGDVDTQAADRASETLLSMGIHRLDGLILTHYDSDHAGGIPELLTRIQTDAVFLPENAENEQAKQVVLDACGEKAVFLREDTKLSWEQSSLMVFAPLSYAHDNESGLCVLFHTENCDILITGDLNSNGEGRLVLEKDIPNLTALVAGHHGSPTSTGAGLLAALKPQYVFISVGEDNPYGHPSQAVLDRLAQYDCKVFRTDLDGTIVFRR